MKRLSKALIAVVGLGVFALGASARGDEVPDRADVGKPRTATDDLKNWRWFVEIPEPKAGMSDHFDFVVPPVIFDKTGSEALHDLRLRDAKDRDIPYALFVRRAQNKREPVSVKPFTPVTHEDRSVSVSLEVQLAPTRHNEIEIATSGQNYRRRVKVESSEDGTAWNVLIEQELIFFQFEKQAVDVRAFTYPENRRRFLRVTVHPDPGKKDDKPVLNGVMLYQSVVEKGEDVILPAQLGMREPTRVGGATGSQWPLTFNGKKVPVEKLLIEVQEGVFERSYRLESVPPDDTTGLERWAMPFNTVTSGAWSRGFDFAGTPLEVRFPELFTRQLRLAVADGNNPPLSIKSVRYQAPARQVIFAKSAEIEWPVKVYFGNPQAQDPAWDFKKTVSPQMDPPPVRLEIAAGEAKDNPVYRPPPVPWSEENPWLVYAVLGFASVVLCGIMAMLGKEALTRTGT